MARLILDRIGTPLEAVVDPKDQARNTARMADLESALSEKRDVVHAGWGEKYVQRVHEKGKWTTWERIEALKDPDSPVHEVGTLVNWDRTFAGSRRQAPGAGVVTAFCRVHGRWTMVIANDNTVASGAWWPLTPEKIERAQEMALRLRLPLVYLVDCSGLFLPEQANSFSGRTGAGHIFTMNARIAAAGVPQIAGVFGDCIAGGGYMPIISDRVYMTEGAYMVIAGAALIRGAKSQKLTSLDIGGPEVHVHQSRCADERVPDDETAIRMIRAEMGRLPSTAVDFYRHGARPSAPAFPPEELQALFPPDFRQVYSIEQVLARLVDDSLFHEVLGDVGREMITGIGRVSGLWMGFIANRQGIIDEPGIGRRPGSALYREGIAKISEFARSCNADGIPIVWLQDISGFDIGVQAERQGLLGYGSNLIYGNSTVDVPVFSVLLRKASGAGYYAMSGLPYEPVVQLATPITRLAVMEGRTLAIAAFNSKLDDDFEIAATDPEEVRQIEEGMAKTAARIEADMDPVKAAARMDADEIVPLGELRSWLTCLAECAWQSMGYRRTKNPRIWSLHDLAVLTRRAQPRDGGAQRVAKLTEERLCATSVGTWVPSVQEGSPVRKGDVLGVLQRAGGTLTLVAPARASGAASKIRPTGSWVEAGEVLMHLGDAVIAAGDVGEHSETTGLGEGETAVRSDTDGTIYLRPEPDAAPFVTPGTRVTASQTVALIEVMKTFSPVQTGVAGEIVQVLVDDGAAVTAGELLFTVRP